jgi:hypothetical protein
MAGIEAADHLIAISLCQLIKLHHYSGHDGEFRSTNGVNKMENGPEPVSDKQGVLRCSV